MTDSRFLNRPYRSKGLQKQHEAVVISKLRQEVERYKVLSATVKTELEELKVEIENARVFIPSREVVPTGSETGSNSPKK